MFYFFCLLVVICYALGIRLSHVVDRLPPPLPQVRPNGLSLFWSVACPFSCALAAGGVPLVTKRRPFPRWEFRFFFVFARYFFSLRGGLGAVVTPSKTIASDASVPSFKWWATAHPPPFSQKQKPPSVWRFCFCDFYFLKYHFLKNLSIVFLKGRRFVDPFKNYSTNIGCGGKVLHCFLDCCDSFFNSTSFFFVCHYLRLNRS